MKNKIKQIILGILIAFTASLYGNVSASVYALEKDYDFSQKGSITLALNDLGTNPEGVIIACYQVGYIENGQSITYRWIDALESLPYDVTQLNTVESQKEASNAVEKAIQGLSITSYRTKTDKNGKAIFSNLNQGIYLIVMEDGAGYGSFDSFLTAIPYTDNSDRWVYDIEAEVKGAVKEEEKDDTHTSTQTDSMFYTSILVISGFIIVFMACVWYRNKRSAKNR